MKLIESSVEILPQENTLEGVYKQIELAGRTCYKSEKNITDNSAKDFVDKMINNNHTAMLEHGTLYFDIPPTEGLRIDNFNDLLWNPYAKVINKWHHFYITTNLRVIKEHDINGIMPFMCEPRSFHEKRITARFICDRGIMAELTRHRVFSFAVESTRYCNYSRDKFNNELTFIKPTWFDEKENIRPEFMSQLANIENTYMNMISTGCKAQEARQILPNALKTEVVMTGFVSDWKHFFDLRCAPNAHPDMQVLANQLKEQFEQNKLI